MPDDARIETPEALAGRLSPRGHHLKVWLTAFAMMSAVFMFGAVVGGVASVQFVKSRMEKRFQEPGAFMDRALIRMSRELSLSDTQTETIRGILDTHRDTIQRLHEEFRPKIEAEFDALEKNVAAALNPEQAELWNQRFDEERGRWLRPQGPFGRGGGAERGPGPDGPFMEPGMEPMPRGPRDGGPGMGPGHQGPEFGEPGMEFQPRGPRRDQPGFGPGPRVPRQGGPGMDFQPRETPDNGPGMPPPPPPQPRQEDRF